MPVYRFDVDVVYGHDSLKEGRIVDFWVTVMVEAKNEAEADLIAQQMACVYGMPTATYYCY